ncbi:eCIS core domain-containing protein [Natrinema hispanicum]|nr:DUF4157 domain-containing protein [Natrinema hispanicum]
MSDGGTGEALKMGMTQAGKQSGLPFGQIMGSLSGAALQAIYNNRKQVDVTAMGRYAQRSQRSSDESTSSTPLSIRQSLDSDSSIQRPNDTTATDAEMPKSIGGFGAAERLQRAKSQAGSATERVPSGSHPSAHWNAGRNAPTSLQRTTAAAQDTSPAGETQVPDSVRDVISSPGRSLNPSIQRAMEDRMGDSLGDVRIHTGPKAAQACEQINARAFTVGNHVAFNSGEYDPESPEGQHVLAHELAHVRQQTGGAVSMLPQEQRGLEIDPDPRLEREAEETAQRVMEGGELGIQRLRKTDVHIQRKEKVSRREFFTGTTGAEETAAALEEVTDPQSLLERVVSGAQEIDWVSVFKKAGIAAFKSNPAAKAAVSAADEIDSQLRADSVAEGDLIATLEQHEPPQSWVETIAKQAAEMIGKDTGSGNSQGVLEMGEVN